MDWKSSYRVAGGKRSKEVGRLPPEVPPVTYSARMDRETGVTRRVYGFTAGDPDEPC